MTSTRDSSATRRRILDHAGRLFALRGFAGVTVKGIADAAGVSPNLITRYFGGKDGVFLAATRVEIAVGDALEGDRATLGERLAAGIVDRWHSDAAADPMLILHRASGERPEAAEALSEFLDRSSLQPLRAYLERTGLDRDTARARAQAIDALVLGVSTRQRVLRSDLDDRDALRTWLGAAIQRLADG